VVDISTSASTPLPQRMAAPSASDEPAEMPTSITRSCAVRSAFTRASMASIQRSYGSACCTGAAASKE